MSKMMMAVALALSAATGVTANRDFETGIFTRGEFFIGCNYWAKNAGMYMWSEWRPDVVERELSELAKYDVRVLRVFPLWPDFQPLTGDCYGGGQYRSFLQRNRPLQNPAGVDEEMLKRFRTFCDMAQKNDIKLIVGLVTGWMSGRQFVPGVFEEKNVLSDPKAVMWQTRFVKHFVDSLKDHPAIAAWDYGNECNCLGANDQAAFYNWMEHIGSAIRLRDPSRPVVSGMHSLSTCETDNAPIRLNGELSDILCTHPYSDYVPGCGTEPFNTMRAELHPTAESLLYRCLGGRPCFIEEIGNLGTAHVNDTRSAAGMRVTLFSAWANDLKGCLWWCNSDQEVLDFPPYTLTANERELGLLRQDYSPKPVMLEMRDFERFRKSLPFGKLPLRKPDSVIVVPEKCAGWIQGFGAYLLCRQAGLDPDFAGAENAPLPEADLYVVTSVESEKGYSYPAQQRFFEKAKAGATVAVILSGNARYTHFREQTGVEIDHMVRTAVERTFTLDAYPDRAMTCRDTSATHLVARECETLGTTSEGEPALTCFKYGRGQVMVINAPVDRMSIARTDCFTGKSLMPYYLLFREVMRCAGIRKKVDKGDCPQLCLTEHPRADGSTVVMCLNCESRSVECPVKIDGGLGAVWRGKVSDAKIVLAPNEVALFEVK